jgi:hypothetical protein
MKALRAAVVAAASLASLSAGTTAGDVRISGANAGLAPAIGSHDLIPSTWSADAPARRALKPKKGSPIVCIDNVEDNPRTASLFEKGTLNQGSKFYWMMKKKADHQQVECGQIVLLVEYNINSKRVRALKRASAGAALCVLA